MRCDGREFLGKGGGTDEFAAGSGSRGLAAAADAGLALYCEVVNSRTLRKFNRRLEDVRLVADTVVHAGSDDTAGTRKASTGDCPGLRRMSPRRGTLIIPNAVLVMMFLGSLQK